MATSSKRVRRTKAVGSPEPKGIASMNPTCGHSGCGQSCMVRYCGPTSPMHNHHIVHAARGVTHVWTAAIVSGFAVVLTGAIAFSAVQAAETRTINDPMILMLRALHRIEMRLDRMEPRLNRLSESAAFDSGMGASDLMYKKNLATSTNSGVKNMDAGQQIDPAKPKVMPAPDMIQKPKPTPEAYEQSKKETQIPQY